MFNNILLPVLLSNPDDASDAAAKAQGLLAEGGKITLLHVIEPLPTYVEPYFPAEIHEQTFQAAKEQLKSIADRLDLKGTALVQGSVGRSIVAWAEENDADCIVMASHQPAFSDLFLGSSAAWVVRHARCSVLVLR
ncbi:Universal stress family protein [Candidatus Rhodobacter oscarellae]|uniref:Universal stress family protein n=1 Tax=Candidatus Rhodobacter oscarellae TaxID=1675527 RepID=A0A0J9EED4_9RHOB|nr:universal stress protein [Candidatus Rhodobacter lobularis]KMW60079.1 Universal stress family protein [Candidatus Rhodobacter lobularis]